jgi:hypothetical protein
MVMRGWHGLEVLEAGNWSKKRRNRLKGFPDGKPLEFHFNDALPILPYK